MWRAPECVASWGGEADGLGKKDVYILIWACLPSGVHLCEYDIIDSVQKRIS